MLLCLSCPNVNLWGTFYDEFSNIAWFLSLWMSIFPAHSNLMLSKLYAFFFFKSIAHFVCILSDNDTKTKRHLKMKIHIFVEFFEYFFSMKHHQILALIHYIPLLYTRYFFIFEKWSNSSFLNKFKKLHLTGIWNIVCCCCCLMIMLFSFFKMY